MTSIVIYVQCPERDNFRTTRDSSGHFGTNGTKRTDNNGDAKVWEGSLLDLLHELDGNCPHQLHDVCPHCERELEMPYCNKGATQ
jgi:hypothetical protein